jgi:hypothetical protein
LFELADRVIESGEPLVIVRNGVRLRLIREESAEARKPGRLSRLVQRDIVIGPPLDPHESPAEWSGEPLRVADHDAKYGAKKPQRNRRK